MQNRNVTISGNLLCHCKILWRWSNIPITLFLERQGWKKTHPYRWYSPIISTVLHSVTALLVIVTFLLHSPDKNSLRSNVNKVGKALFFMCRHRCATSFVKRRPSRGPLITDGSSHRFGVYEPERMIETTIQSGSLKYQEMRVNKFGFCSRKMLKVGIHKEEDDLWMRKRQMGQL